MKKQFKKKNNKNKNGNYQLAKTPSYSTYQRPRFTFLDTHLYMTFKYAESITSSIATTLGTNLVYRLNSIFDPTSAVGGTQPYGYDQMAALYNRYRVLKTRWIVTFNASSAGYNAYVIPSNGALNAPSADLTSFTSCIMTPFDKYQRYALNGEPPIFKGSMDLNVLGGVTREEYLADDRFEAQIGANPSEVISLNIGIQNPSAGTISIPFMVELFYETDLHDPISLVAS